MAEHLANDPLVVSTDERNQVEDDIIVIPIFTRGEIGPTHVPIRRGAGGLQYDSLLFCEEITTLNLEFLEEGPLGERVPESLLRRVVRAIRIAVGDVPMPGQ